ACSTQNAETNDSFPFNIEKSVHPTKAEIIETSPTRNIDEDIEKKIWNGESDGFKIRWTTKDIYVESDKGVEKVFSYYTERLFEKNYKYEREYSEKLGKYIQTKKILEMENCSVWFDGEIASLVGSTMTIETEVFLACGIMQYYKHLVVLNLNKPKSFKLISDTKEDEEFVGSSVKLTEFFSDEQILEALLKNNKVRAAIEKIDKEFKPKNTSELIEWFEKKDKELYELDNDKRDWGMEDVSFGEDYNGRLTRRLHSGFAFDRLENGKVIVKVGLNNTHKSHMLPSLELEFNVPEKLRKELELANSKQQGFLYKDRVEDFSSQEFNTAQEKSPKK
ncbi:MAG: hypothetical protein LC768_07465, partial [Acidobacteria bacterium]|nr:hypothetical protein [Acidobacteriota bacterium]MCA1638160.1 hypothetical protein [Acidobacteriota bacterium]